MLIEVLTPLVQVQAHGACRLQSLLGLLEQDEQGGGIHVDDKPGCGGGTVREAVDGPFHEGEGLGFTHEHEQRMRGRDLRTQRHQHRGRTQTSPFFEHGSAPTVTSRQGCRRSDRRGRAY